MEGERVGRWDKGAIWPGKGVGGDCDVGREVFVLPVAHPGRITTPSPGRSPGSSAAGQGLGSKVISAPFPLEKISSPRLGVYPFALWNNLHILVF